MEEFPPEAIPEDEDDMTDSEESVYSGLSGDDDESSDDDDDDDGDSEEEDDGDDLRDPDSVQQVLFAWSLLKLTYVDAEGMQS